MMSMENPVAEMGLQECWQLLGENEFGRLAYRLVDEVHIVPINYIADGRSILMRTAAGNKLLAAALDSDVALEIDWRDEASAWSVVARGRLRRLDEAEQHRLDRESRHSWVPTPKSDVIELDPQVVTGRRFQLARDGDDLPAW